MTNCYMLHKRNTIISPPPAPSIYAFQYKQVFLCNVFLKYISTKTTITDAKLFILCNFVPSFYYPPPGEVLNYLEFFHFNFSFCKMHLLFHLFWRPKLFIPRPTCAHTFPHNVSILFRILFHILFQSGKARVRLKKWFSSFFTF